MRIPSHPVRFLAWWFHDVGHDAAGVAIPLVPGTACTDGRSSLARCATAVVALHLPAELARPRARRSTQRVSAIG
ncbi:MAG: hypothetical protein RL148_673 [Planctomycetota bacterium]